MRSHSSFMPAALISLTAACSGPARAAPHPADGAIPADGTSFAGLTRSAVHSVASRESELGRTHGGGVGLPTAGYTLDGHLHGFVRCAAAGNAAQTSARVPGERYQYDSATIPARHGADVRNDNHNGPLVVGARTAAIRCDTGRPAVLASGEWLHVSPAGPDSGQALSAAY